MAREVREGLSAPLPELPCKYFYDAAGSALFDRITELPEYYPTRVEESILAARADEIARMADAAELVELGSGLGRKTRMLLEALGRRGRLRSCVLLDVDAAALRTSIAALRALRPGIAARGVAGDFLRDLRWLGPRRGTGGSWPSSAARSGTSSRRACRPSCPRPRPRSPPGTRSSSASTW